MSVQADLLERSLALPDDQRAELAYQLLRSLGDEPSEDDETVRLAWAAESDRRADQVDEGRVVMEDRKQVMDELRASLRRAKTA
ncbi:MAG: addiction module protein [Tepidisphaeraceae bacterium]|jgi:hypothetical protein